MTRDHRAATRTILIESVYRRPIPALGTRALVDAALDYCISSEHRTDYNNCEYDPHSVSSLQPPLFMNFWAAE